MLKKNFRLPIQEWMKDKKSKTTTAKGDFFIARKKYNEKSIFRFGVVVSAKVFKGAVKRNRLRRKIFEAVRVAGLAGEAENGKGEDILLSVLPAAAKADEKEVIGSLSPVLKKIK